MEKVISVKEMQQISDRLRAEGKTIGFVPTMGFFHPGHVSLMKRVKEDADICITSLFVNPTQFGPNEDYASYPRNLEGDSIIAKQGGCDYLFIPNAKELYPSTFQTFVTVNNVTKKFEGATRPEHFKGVATIVAKLFNIVKPHYAIFGQKDYQQTLVIRKLTEDLNFDLKIIVAPTFREKDGLAMSSRNTYLSREDRKKAGVIFRALETARMAIEQGERKRLVINGILHKILREVPEIKIDYASAVSADELEEQEAFDAGQKIVMLIAVFLGKTRLIDNSIITIPALFPPSGKKFIEGL